MMARKTITEIATDKRTYPDSGFHVFGPRTLPMNTTSVALAALEQQSSVWHVHLDAGRQSGTQRRRVSASGLVAPRQATQPFACSSSAHRA
jgi:hypothetical protein